jgi:beta-glucosidase
VLKISIDVTNTGKMAGKESVLLYSSDLVATMTPDGRRLRQFDKVELQPGETHTISLRLPASDLAFVGFDGRWTLEAGDFDLSIGTLTTRVVCDETYTWKTANKE